MCSSSIFILILTVTISLSTISDVTAAMLVPCTKCVTEAECNQPPRDCTWGESRNYCGRRVCSKGPGEKCGGRFIVQGTCGEGMWCSKSENRCQGCYIQNMSCYPDVMP